MKKFITKTAAAVAIAAAATLTIGAAVSADNTEADAAGLWPYQVKTNAGLWPY